MSEIDNEPLYEGAIRAGVDSIHKKTNKPIEEILNEGEKELKENHKKARRGNLPKNVVDISEKNWERAYKNVRRKIKGSQG